MPAYHQMGHDSTNLLAEPQLNHYKGAILSPVNLTEAEMVDLLAPGGLGLEFIFDPQLYYPQAQREILRSWSYFPSDVDTADASSLEWWKKLCSDLVASAARVDPDAICSPVVVPRAYSWEYFQNMCDVTRLLEDIVGPDTEVIHTVLVGSHELASYSAVMTLASIVTRLDCRRMNLILTDGGYPRRELADPEELKGMMLLIKSLSDNGIRVLVSYCSSDVLLWKEAGAEDVASGKFFNLRRFTPSRWDEAGEGGGGQVPYWFEEALMAFLRASDVTRVQAIGLISDASKANPFAPEILHKIGSGDAWLGLSWRFYLYWFQELESRMANGTARALDILERADRGWGQIETSSPRIYLEERQNTGDWIRQWLRAVAEYKTPW